MSTPALSNDGRPPAQARAIVFTRRLEVRRAADRRPDSRARPPSRSACRPPRAAGSELASSSGSVRRRLSWRKPSRFMPGVDLQVIAERRPVLRGGRLHGARRGRRRDRRRQRELEQAVEIADAQRAEDQNRHAHAGAAQHDRPPRCPRTPAWSAPACSSASATRSAPWPYALALTTAMTLGARAASPLDAAEPSTRNR